MRNLVGHIVHIVDKRGEYIDEGKVISQDEKYYTVNSRGVLLQYKRKHLAVDMFMNDLYLPKKVLSVLERYALDELSTKQGYRLQKQLKKVGYKFDWDADGSPTFLRKKKKKKKTVPRETKIVNSTYC